MLVLSGTSFVKTVKGFFCRLCKKYLNEDVRDDHVASKDHYEKFVEAVAIKKEKAEAQKQLKVS